MIVTGGFIGNVVLKEAGALHRLVAAKGVCKGYFEMFNFEDFGVSTAKAVKNMLLHSAEAVEAGLIKRIKEELNR